MSFFIFFRVAFVTFFRIARAILGFLVGIVLAVVDAFSRIFMILFSVPSLITLAILAAITLIGLPLVLKTEFFMRLTDMTYECGLYKIADGTTTFVLKPLRDYVWLNNAMTVNDILEQQKDDARRMVDRIEAVVDRNHIHMDDGIEIFNSMWDFIVYDIPDAPNKVPNVWWGPKHRIPPFEDLLVQGALRTVVDNVLINRHILSLVKNITMSVIKLDLLTESCYFQHMPSPDGTHWMFKGCDTFEGSCHGLSDHLNGTCEGCHNFDSELAYYLFLDYPEYLVYLITNVTKELLVVDHSVNAFDVCSVFEGLACHTSPGGCACSYNCSKVPWWVDPDSMESLNCHDDLGLPYRGIVPPLIGRVFPEFPTCDILNDCIAKPHPGKCAHVSDELAFYHMNCDDVAAKTTLGGSCHTDDNIRCHHDDWAYWTDHSVRWITPIFHNGITATYETMKCLIDWVLSIIGSIVLFADRTCEADWMEIFKYVVTNNVFKLPYCAKYLIEFVVGWKFNPLAVGTVQLYELIMEMGPTLLDGTILTKSKYYCDLQNPAYHGCIYFDIKYQDHGCQDVDAYNVKPGYPTGMVLHGTCAAAGYGRHCPLPLPCPELDEDEALCSFFVNKICIDYDDSPQRLLIPFKNCSSLRGGCKFRDFTVHDDVTTCSVFEGCHLFSGDGWCEGELHTFTDRFFWILNGTFSNVTVGFMEWSFEDWKYEATRKQMKKAVVFFESITETFRCITDSFKSVFGFFVLIFDNTCDASSGIKMDYFVEIIISGTIHCLDYIADLFRSYGWKTVGNLWQDSVDVIADILPHFWSGAIFNADTYYCNEKIYIEIIPGYVVYWWNDGEWAYTGCYFFDGGVCAADWENCPHSSPQDCHKSDFPNTSDPIRGLFDVFYDIIEEIILQLDAAWGIDNYANITEFVLDLLKAIIDFLHCFLIAWPRNILGFILMVVDDDCEAQYSGAVGIYLIQQVFFFPILCLEELIIDVIDALGEVIESFWSLIWDLITYILRSTKAFSWIFSAIDDATMFGYCFHASLPCDEQNDPTPNEIFHWRCIGDIDLYNFPACVAVWPGPYLSGDSCSLESCFTRAWDCVKYSDMETLEERDYDWLGNALSSPIFESMVEGIMMLADAVVCPFNCMADCDECGLVYQIPCIFKCFEKPWDYTCTGSVWGDMGGQPDITLSVVLEDLYDYRCDSLCVCKNPENTYACYAYCFAAEGNARNKKYPCPSLPDMGESCSQLYNHDEVHDWRYMPAPFNSRRPSPFCLAREDDYTSGYQPSEWGFMFNNLDRLFNKTLAYNHDIHHRYNQAKAVCDMYCPHSQYANGSIATKILGMASCLALQMIMIDPGNVEHITSLYTDQDKWTDWWKIGPCPKDIHKRMNQAPDRWEKLSSTVCRHKIKGNPPTTAELFCGPALYTEAPNMYKGTPGARSIAFLVESYFCGVIDCRCQHLLKRLVSWGLYYTDHYRALEPDNTDTYIATNHYWLTARENDEASFDTGWHYPEIIFNNVPSACPGVFYDNSFIWDYEHNPYEHPLPPAISSYLPFESEFMWDFYSSYDAKHKGPKRRDDFSLMLDPVEEYIRAALYNHTQPETPEQTLHKLMEKSEEEYSLFQGWLDLKDEINGTNTSDCACMRIFRNWERDEIPSQYDRIYMKALERYCFIALRKYAVENRTKEAIDLMCVTSYTDFETVQTALRFAFGVKETKSAGDMWDESEMFATHGEETTILDPENVVVADPQFVAFQFTKFITDNKFQLQQIPETLKNIAFTTASTLYAIYNDSFIQNAVNSGMVVYKNASKTDADIDAWATDVMLDFYSIITENDMENSTDNTQAYNTLRYTIGKIVGKDNANKVDKMLNKPFEKKKKHLYHKIVPSETTLKIKEIIGEKLEHDTAVETLHGSQHNERFYEDLEKRTKDMFMKTNSGQNRREEKNYMFYKGSENTIYKVMNNTKVYFQYMNVMYEETEGGSLSERDGQNIGLRDTQTNVDINWDYIFDKLGDFFVNLGDDIVDFFESDGFLDAAKDVGNALLEIVECHSPGQYNGTRVYNVFCIAVPEALLYWVPEKVTPRQVDWADELIVQHCHKHDATVREYFEMAPDECEPYADSTRPLCDTCDYCKRTYDPEIVRFDTMDSLFMSVTYAERLIYKFFKMEVENADRVDKAHIIINTVIIFWLVMLSVNFYLGYYPALVSSLAATLIYLATVGLVLQGAFLIVIFVIFGAFVALLFSIGFSVAMVLGGISIKLDLFAFLYNAAQFMLNSWILSGISRILYWISWIFSFLPTRNTRKPRFPWSICASSRPPARS